MGDSGCDPGELSDNRCNTQPVGCLPGICSYSVLSCEAFDLFLLLPAWLNVCLVLQKVGLKHFK